MRWIAAISTAGAVGGSGSANAAQAQIQQSSQELQAAVQSTQGSYDCST
jgi:hypothetical protein